MADLGLTQGQYTRLCSLTDNDAQDLCSHFFLRILKARQKLSEEQYALGRFLVVLRHSRSEADYQAFVKRAKASLTSLIRKSIESPSSERTASAKEVRKAFNGIWSTAMNCVQSKFPCVGSSLAL